ncbi:RNA recognition motif-containing protein [Cyclospora cayetanensis]|uniref:RNA recognition motif-containing protein n=1 Tax=Cyclospora cayetanensis TaxID=88456 RepID=A0A1D3D5B2_9EIME|nr:RNA recognition motif-containing protein [Cyclospora cayetanensis]
MAKSMLDMSLDDIVEAQRREGRAERGEGPIRRGGYMRGEGAYRGGRGGASGGYGSYRGGRGGYGGPSPRGRGGVGPYAGPYGGAPSRASPRSAVVRISGLDYSVLESELRELFESVGGLNKVWIDFDRTDRSLGTGGCVFKSVSDARRAVEAFDGRRIEGKALHLELQGPRGVQGDSDGFRGGFRRGPERRGGPAEGRQERRFREPRFVEPW